MTSRLVLAALAWAGCGPVTTIGDDGDAAVEDPGNCVVDTSTGPESAIPLGVAPADGQLCPRGDRDWYALEVPAGVDLLDLSVGYPTAVTRVAALAQLFADDGTTPIPDGQVTDTRSGARKGVVASTLRVPQPGRFRLVVRDATDSQSDALNGYVLSVATAKDPDMHEPNDTAATARAADGQPGWLAYRNDRDVYKITVPPGNALVTIRIDNPPAAKGVLRYALTDEKGVARGGGVALAEGEAPPSATPLIAQRLLPSAAGGDFFVTLSTGEEVAPDRTPAAAYTLALSAKPELDPNDQGVRNDRAATATCLGGGPPGQACAQAFFGQPVSFSGGGQIGSLGDRDFFRFDVSGGAPAVVEIEASMVATSTQLAVDLLFPHAGSACKTDGDCAAVKEPCDSDTDCELSHSCLPAAAYHFCPGGQSCRLCAGASACVPDGRPGGSTVCAVPQYLVHDATRQNVLRTAQPVLAAVPYYVVVHDYQDDAFDHGTDYRLAVRVVPEPDAGDQPASPPARDNFYNPYPMQSDDLRPSRMRARDVDADLVAGRPVRGVISYASDEDWFSFRHPCPMLDCGLVFEWTQPGPSPVRVAFLVRRDDLGIHESFTYNGQTPTSALPNPVTSTFGEGDCRECSFASARYQGSRYFVQVRAVGSASWDFSGAGEYSFRLKAVTPGCPAQCSEMPGVCGCYCASEKRCPPGLAL